MAMTEAERERWMVRLAFAALPVSLIALFFTFLQWKSAERAADIADHGRIDANNSSAAALAVAEQARKDAVNLAERQRADAQLTLTAQRNDAAAALDAQTRRADRANIFADRSANAAEATAKAAALQVEVADRPWLSIDVRVNGPITFDSNGANMPTLVTFTNTGHSPAAGLWFTGFLFPGRLDPVAEREKMCSQLQEQAIANPRLVTEVIFPGTSPPRQEIFTSGKDKLNVALKQMDGMVAPTLIVCAAYHPAFSPSSIHQTALIYLVLAATDPTNPSNCVAFRTDGVAPISRPCLYSNPIGGSYAN